MRVRVFGAGPAGARAAELLATEGYDVTLYEEHDEIGSPIACTGILTNAINDVLDVPKSVIDFNVHNVRVHAPNKDTLPVLFDKPNYIVNRTKFDSWLVDRAEKAGVTVETGTRLMQVGSRLKIKTKSGEKYLKHGITVGADGPQSRVSKHINPDFKKEYFGGYQITIRYDNPGAIEFYPAIKDIAWATPENTTHMRVGVMARGNTKQIFDAFREKYPGMEISKQPGAIPYYQPNLKRSANGFYTIGDAAGMVKATTGGGIVQGLKAAPILTKAIAKDKDYDKLWKRNQGVDLWLHRKIRERLSTFSDEKWNSLIADCKQAKTQDILNSIPRDYPKAMLPKLLTRNIKLLKYVGNPISI